MEVAPSVSNCVPGHIACPLSQRHLLFESAGLGPGGVQSPFTSFVLGIIDLARASWALGNVDVDDFVAAITSSL